MTEIFILQQLVYTYINTAQGMVENSQIITSLFSSFELALAVVEKRQNRKKDRWNPETWVEKVVTKTDGTPSPNVIKSWEVVTVNSRIVLIITRNKLDVDPFEEG